jgi:hypothetical protein
MNSGEQLLKLIVKVLWFIVKLLPGLFKLIYKGIKAIIDAIAGKSKGASESNNTENEV